LDVQKAVKVTFFQSVYNIVAVLLCTLLPTAFGYNLDVNPPFPVITSIPERIALLLPLTGEWQAVGEAIQAGFIAANEVQHKPLTINIINTQQYRSISKSYQAAIQWGADLIIGPLLKSEVKALARQPRLQAPVLTLNYLEEQSEVVPANFYQFGLSPLDEAKQITQEANMQKHHAALILAPDNAWGHALAKAFREHWEIVGGSVVDCLYYSHNLPTLTHQIRTLLKFHPPRQRRMDFDVIFLGATPSLGRQINPLLAFYFASNIPVYATATIYDPSLPKHLNRDLENIMICDTPWSVGLQTIHADIRARCIAENPQHFSDYARYYALGTDAFWLARKLLALDKNELTTLVGASGELSLTQNRTIVRQLPCAILKRSALQPLS
jgi:uncharacterized protein